MATPRYLDLQQQGFSRIGQVRRAIAHKPIVTCDDCLNWHRDGKHTAHAATRKINRQARRNGK